MSWALNCRSEESELREAGSGSTHFSACCEHLTQLRLLWPPCNQDL